MAADNKSLGKFILDGIPPAPRGVPQIEVTFDVDANGILKVSAQDKATGRSQHITITASSGLSDAEVEKMRKDAEAHAEDDRKRKELIEARNNADNTAYAAEKALREFGDKVPAEIKAEIETKVAEVKKTAEGEDVAAIKAATESLGQSIQKIGASVYEQNPAAAGGEADSNPNSDAGPDVVDGEVKE
jgi:molecular chaperone DnaK